jgi:hypothetical protein
LERHAWHGRRAWHGHSTGDPQDGINRLCALQILDVVMKRSIGAEDALYILHPSKLPMMTTTTR